MNIKPLYDRVIIEPNQDENINKFGIVLPETSQERPQTGTVVAVGDGESIDSDKKGMKVNINDKVLFNKYSGSEIKFENKKFIILRQIDIIGVIND